MKAKKFISIALAAVLTLGILTGCSSSKTSGSSASSASSAGSDEKGSVYYLSFKPEQEEQWKEIAKKYTEETGVEVKVVTAASGTYEQTLKSEIAKDDAPTLFQINGPVGYQSWKEYCADLKDTELNKHLLNPDLAITDGDGVYGIPYVEEGYGIIYNQAIMDKYFALDGAKAKSMDEINNFDKLKEVAEDMQAKKDDLGIDGVFASTSLTPGEDWRWQTHLANLPIYYEYKDKDVKDLDEIEFTYADNFKNIFDLYINNSTVEPKLLGSKTVTDSMSEFALGKCAMVQNGNWGWGQIADVDGNTVKEEDVKFMPIYTGVKGEEKQGLCIGTENYFCINNKASEADQKATQDFIEWLFTSDEGKDYVTNQLGFIAPFDTFSDDESPQDPLAQEVLKYMSNKDLYNVDWNFTTFPSQQFKDDFGAALLEYCNGNQDWNQVKQLVIDEWASEKALTK
ncbi:MAG: ABC transporter substrate-binding protein [Intestinibacter sp.]|uniref:ABC transporter substrate-binding protein n=1 Tax=Intestinibacter sp. TaxID=1965304 RepID=UPI0025B94D50|nr:ABC transporter substrate-binding protein [Intestinibacter sp.]MCI6738893.1 ABC transporter substrate-binding protein [Intestinibacter sp.]